MGVLCVFVCVTSVNVHVSSFVSFEFMFGFGLGFVNIQLGTRTWCASNTKLTSNRLDETTG